MRVDDIDLKYILSCIEDIECKHKDIINQDENGHRIKLTNAGRAEDCQDCLLRIEQQWTYDDDPRPIVFRSCISALLEDIRKKPAKIKPIHKTFSI